MLVWRFDADAGTHYLNVLLAEHLIASLLTIPTSQVGRRHSVILSSRESKSN